MKEKNVMQWETKEEENRKRKEKIGRRKRGTKENDGEKERRKEDG